MKGAILHGPRAPLPLRRVDLTCIQRNAPGEAFEPELPLEEAAQGCRAVDQRRAINARRRP